MIDPTAISGRPSRERVSAPAGDLLPAGPPPGPGGEPLDVTFHLRDVGRFDGLSGACPLPLPVEADLGGAA